MAATESALAAFRRVRTGYMTTGIAELDRIVTLRPGTMNFIQGAKSTGKTELLMKIVSTCILPAKVGDVEIGGSECRVVYFDNAYKFSLPRLVQLISSKIVGALQQADAANPEQPVLETHFDHEKVVTEALGRLYIVSCTDSFQFRATLASLDRRLGLLSEGLEATKWILIVDGFDDTFWVDRQFSVKQSSLAPGTPQAAALPRIEDVISRFIKSRWTMPAICTCSSKFRKLNNDEDDMIQLDGRVLRYHTEQMYYKIDSSHGFISTSAT